MQLQLQQKHIEAAIRDFVAKAGITFEIDEINFTAGRGKDGLTAAVDLEDPFTSLLDQASEKAEAENPAPMPTVSGNPKPEPAKESPKPEPAKAEYSNEAPPFSAEEVADKVEAKKDESTPMSKQAPAAEPEKPKRKAGALFG